MGFMRQNPPNFRGGSSTGAPRNQQGNLQNAQPAMMASMLRGGRSAPQPQPDKQGPVKGGKAEQYGKVGLAPQQRDQAQWQQSQMPQQRDQAQWQQSQMPQPNQMMGAAVMPPQQQQRQDQMQNQMQRLQGQMGGPRPMPQQAQLQGPGSMPQRPQMPQQMGGKGGRAPQPPGQNPWGEQITRPMQQAPQMGGKGGRAPQPQQYSGGKGGRSSRPPQFGRR